MKGLTSISASSSQIWGKRGLSFFLHHPLRSVVLITGRFTATYAKTKALFLHAYTQQRTPSYTHNACTPYTHTHSCTHTNQQWHLSSIWAFGRIVVVQNLLRCLDHCGGTQRSCCTPSSHSTGGPQSMEKRGAKNGLLSRKPKIWPIIQNVVSKNML